MSKDRSRRPVKKDRGTRPILRKVLALVPLLKAIYPYFELLLRALGLIR